MISLNLTKFNRCDWYIFLWVIYYLQGIAYEEGGKISILILVVIFLLSFNYAIKVLHMKNKPVFFNGLNLLILMFTIYGIFYMFVSPSTVKYPISGMSFKSYNYLKNIYISLLPIYPFFYFSKRGYLTQIRLQKWGYIFIVSVLLCYFRSQYLAMQELLEKGSSRDEVTNNAGYLFLSCIPLLVVYRTKPFLQFIGLAFVMSFIVLGMKRGAIALGGMTSTYLMFNAIKNARGKIKAIIIVLSVIVSIGAVYFFMYQMTHSDYMMQRIQETAEGNSSGRDNLYSFFWIYFTEKANIIYYLIGRGANGTIEIYYNFAHNDWLEIAVNQGLLGVVIFAIYWLCFYRTWKQTSNAVAKAIIAMSLIIYFAKTLFSMSYGDMTYVGTSVLGYALATMNNPNP